MYYSKQNVSNFVIQMQNIGNLGCQILFYKMMIREKKIFVDTRLSHLSILRLTEMAFI